MKVVRMRGGCAAVLAMFALLASGISAAAEIVPGPLPADLIRVIDGDTIEVRAHLWLGLELTTRVRLSDIDAPELDGGCPADRELAKAARAFLTGHSPRRSLYGMFGRTNTAGAWSRGFSP